MAQLNVLKNEILNGAYDERFKSRVFARIFPSSAVASWVRQAPA